MAPRRRQQLTDYEKGLIQGRRDSGQTPALISHCMQIPKSTIKSFLSRAKKRETFDNKQRFGRPRLTSSRDDRFLIRKAKALTRIPLSALRVESNLPLSIRTIQRRLREEGIRKWKAVQRPRLTEKHAATRLKWAKEHLEWTVDMWRKVGWSDECSVEKTKDPRQVWVFRREGAAEKYLPKNVVVKDKARGVSLMVWACFADYYISPLAPLHGAQDKDAYGGVLRDYLQPFYKNLPLRIKNGFIFQQDNAPIHTAHVIKAWLADQDFLTMNWPPNSPDMNPIEHLWFCLKGILHKRYPDTAVIRGGPERVKQVLEERLSEVWQDISRETLEGLVKSMPARVSALYAAKGWYTRF